MAPRSRTGCLTCRQRKLKCSEERPICAQCVKAQRPCVPSSGITFRHQQNPSMNSNEDGLKSFYGYKETFGKSTTWVEIPKDLTFVHTNNPYEDEDGEDNSVFDQHGQHGFSHGHHAQDFTIDQSSYPAYATHGLEALSAVAVQGQYNTYAPQPAPMSQHERTTSQSTTSVQQSHATTSQNIDFILNPPSALSPAESALDPRLHSPTVPSPQQSPSDVRIQSFASHAGRTDLLSKGLSGRPAIEDAELAFLLRDYAERPGFWMDEFDLDLFFAAKVPVLAVTCPLLLYACASLSSKSLARVSGRKPVMGGMVPSSRQSKMEFWPGPPLDQEGWIHKGRQYYDIAVSLLRQALAGASRPPTSSLPEDATPATLSNVQNAPLPPMDSDELVAATAILCVYEFLDASGPEWSRHLDGAKTLFDIAKDRMMVPLTLPPSPVSIAQQVTRQLAGQPAIDHVPSIRGLSAGRRAVFWNFARQDMLSAFINNNSTRLDTEDLPMWRSAGLKLTTKGNVLPSNPQCFNYVAEQAMGDDMVSNALVWLTMKLVNFIAAGKDDVPADLSPLGLGVRQRELLSYWDILDEQLRIWHDGLPDGFHPPAIRIANPEDGTEMWFPRPMCASTMQWYNFCRIQLLHNKLDISTGTPVQGVWGPGAPGSSLARRHTSYPNILAQSRSHAKEIVAIALGRHDEGTRIHAVQPLWTAGLVLGDDRLGKDGQVGAETEGWRRTIVDLLRGIEEDMGWASEYRVQSLLDRWKTSPPSWPMNSDEP